MDFPYFTFPGNLSASRPKSLRQSVLPEVSVSFHFDFILNIFCSVFPVFVSITALLRYRGKGSSSICVAMLCVTIVIVGAT